MDLWRPTGEDLLRCPGTMFSERRRVEGRTATAEPEAGSATIRDVSMASSTAAIALKRRRSALCVPPSRTMPVTRSEV